jgi:hypothetical protein
MIVAQPGGCNAAVDYTTRGLTMPKEDGSGHTGEKVAGPGLRRHPAVLVFPGWEVASESAA